MNTDYSQTLLAPHGSRPHGHDRSLALCVNDPVSWKSTPVLQTTECPDEDLSLLDPETYSDTTVSNTNYQHPEYYKYTWVLNKFIHHVYF